jgi:hypothetical protein
MGGFKFSEAKPLKAIAGDAAANAATKAGKKVDDLVDSGVVDANMAKKLENPLAKGEEFTADQLEKFKNMKDEDFDAIADFSANMADGMDPNDLEKALKFQSITKIKASKLKDLPDVAGGTVADGVKAGAKVNDASLLKSLANVPGATMGKIGSTIRSIGTSTRELIEYCEKHVTGCLAIGGLTGLAYYMIVTGQSNPMKALGHAIGTGLAGAAEGAAPVFDTIFDSFGKIFSKFWWIGAIIIAVIILFMMIKK